MIATQRAVRGPRPASPCTHLRGAPAATLGNHHVANGVENRRWGDRRRTGVPRVKREAAEDAAKYATQNTGHGTLWGWRAGAAGPQGPHTTPLLPKPHTCACDASSRKRSGAGNARGLPRCRAPVNVDGGPHQGKYPEGGEGKRSVFGRGPPAPSKSTSFGFSKTGGEGCHVPRWGRGAAARCGQPHHPPAYRR